MKRLTKKTHHDIFTLLVHARDDADWLLRELATNPQSCNLSRCAAGIVDCTLQVEVEVGVANELVGLFRAMSDMGNLVAPLTQPLVAATVNL